MKESKCIACGKSEGKLFIRAPDRYDPENFYSYKKCSNCNLVYLSNRKSNKGFQTYNLSKPSKAQKIVMWLFYQRLKKFKKKGRILDFGCGTGNLSKYLSSKKYNVDCLEIDKISIDWIKKVQRLTIINRPEKEKYDIIIVNQVFEHLSNPIEELKKLKRSLKKDGIIIITLPNINSTQAKFFGKDWFHMDAPRHLNHFYKNSFERIIHQENMKIIKTHYFNLDIDLTGWYWSWRKPKFNQKQATYPILALAVFVPLVILTSFFKSTGGLMHIIKK